jgi:hypothetical protein
MSCGGGHLGFPIGIKQKLGKGHSNDHSFKVWVQIFSGDPNCFFSKLKKK